MNIKRSLRMFKLGVIKNSPTILTFSGTIGVVTTALLTIRPTIKAVRMIDEENRKRFESFQPPLKGTDIAKMTWMLYLPPLASGALTIVCIVSSNKINLQRNAALLGLYALSEASLKDYQEKVRTLLGEGKDEKIRGEIAQDKLDKNPVKEDQIIITGFGDCLFYDSLSGRYFKTDWESIRKNVNDYNASLFGEYYQTLNDWYELIGLEPVEMGKKVGWEANNGLLELYYSAKIAEISNKKQPCVVIEYKNGPKDL